ncbi:hypothetical protein [Sulfurisphaera ohwakuensis]|nr:hypothetical protein [Sulfurisphaera ohwakuensis]
MPIKITVIFITSHAFSSQQLQIHEKRKYKCMPRRISMEYLAIIIEKE